jgi:lipoprotein-anchoring transpeptidase ErfK/SrfK
MIKTIVTLACCALIAPLGFGKSHPKHRGKTTTTTAITVTGTIITAAEDGAAANYQPAKTLVIRQDNAADPGRYTLDRPGHIVDKRGHPVVTSVQPGTRVRVYYANVGDQKVIDHVVVLD